MYSLTSIEMRKSFLLHTVFQEKIFTGGFFSSYKFQLFQTFYNILSTFLPLKFILVAIEIIQ